MMLDYYSRKQSHVTRATFMAELLALLDPYGSAVKVLACLTECDWGTASAGDLLSRYEKNALCYELHVVIDAKSILECVRNTKQVKPTDESLSLHILRLIELCKAGRISTLWWVDTRDMVSDALTKGGIPRTAIDALVEQGMWDVQFPAECYSADVTNSSTGNE